MPKMTLLKMTQDILSDINSDNVNSIDDTIESLQVASILESVYYRIIENDAPWPHLGTLLQLDASGDVTRPSHMKLPEDLIRIENIKYNKKQVGDTREKYEDVSFIEPSDFLRLTSSRNSDLTEVDVISDFSGVDLLIINNKAPEFYTTFDDEWIVFDSYDSDIETSLQKAKTQCFGERRPVFTQSDTFVPDLPDKVFSYYLSEAKSVAFERVKEAPSFKEEQVAQSGRRAMSQERWRAKGSVSYKNFGRKTRK